MPQILVTLTLDELRGAVARYVAEECDMEVDAGSLVFEHDQDGTVVGARFDVAPTPPEEGGEVVLHPEARAEAIPGPIPSPAAAEPVFKLSNVRTGRLIAKGPADHCIRMINGNMSKAIDEAKAWIGSARVGDPLALETLKGDVIYLFERLS